MWIQIKLVLEFDHKVVSSKRYTWGIAKTASKIGIETSNILFIQPMLKMIN